MKHAIYLYQGKYEINTTENGVKYLSYIDSEKNRQNGFLLLRVILNVSFGIL